MKDLKNYSAMKPPVTPLKDRPSAGRRVLRTCFFTTQRHPPPQTLLDPPLVVNIIAP